MCDDFTEDFDGDFDGEPGDYEDDGFCDEDFEDVEPVGENGNTPESDNVPWDDLEWLGWMIIGPLSEEIAKEKREKGRIRRENDKGVDDYWNKIVRRW